MTPSRPLRIFRLRVMPMLLGCAMALASAPSFAQGNSRAAKFYEDALDRYEKKDLPGTIIQLKNALQIDPNMLAVQLLLGKALMESSEVVAAEVALNEALRIGVNRAEVVVMLGQAFVAQGKQKLLIEQKTFDPAGLPPGVQLQLHLLRASAYSDLGDPRSALRSIDEARAIDNRNVDSWLAEVPIRIRARQFKEANAAADRALGLSPGAPNVWYEKGSILHVQGDVRGALAAYDRVLQSNGAHVEARVARIGLLLDVARFDDAARDIRELQKVSPREPRGAYMKALLAERDGKPADAAAALKEVTDLLDPVPLDFIRYRPQLLMLNGLAHFGLSQGEKAKQYLEAFQRIQNNSPASKLLAQIYLADGNAGMAITVLESYLRAQPGDGQALTLLASAHIASGRPARASALMQEALKSRDNPAFRTALGISLVRGGRTSDGVAELEAAFKKDPTQIQAAAALVRLYLQGGQSRKAVPVAENLVKRQPGSAMFHNLLGMAQGQSGNAAAARLSFDKALQLDSGMTAAKLNLARLEIAGKSLDAAGIRLQELIKLEPNNSEAFFELAVIADRKGQQAEAQRWLEKARDAAGPKDLRWGLALIEFHLRYGKAGPAMEAAKAASAKAPEDLTTLVAYARAQLASNDPIGARNTLTSATRFAEFNADRQVEVAALQLAANNPAGAAYSLEKALTSQPNHLSAQSLMVEVELRQGNVARAEKRARDLSAQYPRQAVGQTLLGNVAMAQGQPGPAVDAYQRAHQAEPSSGTLLRLFGALYSRDGGKSAFPLAEQWLKTYPRDFHVRKSLADGYARAGNFANAKVNYEAAHKLNPDDGETLNNLANVQLRMKDPGAVKTAELALAKAPGNPVAIDTLGWVLFNNGQAERALQHLRDARLRQPDNPEIRYHLAAALVQAGRKNEAIGELEFALKSAERFEGSEEANKLLKNLR